MLKKRAVSATFWSAIEQIGTSGLSTIFLLIFVRYLSPADFGTFAAATLAIGFASKLALLGLDAVIVQRPQLDENELSTAFWTTFLTSLVLAVSLWASADLIADLFKITEVARLIPYLAIGMVVTTANDILAALLRRELNMKALARRTLLAGVLAGLLATPVVLMYGVFGLVVHSILLAVLTLILTVMLIGWPVRTTFQFRTAVEMIRFGAPLTGANFLTFYNRESPKLFTGLLLSADALGIVSIALRVMNLLLNVIGSTLTRVVMPVMSEVNRSTPDRLLEVYLRLVSLAAAAALPVFSLCIVLREEMVGVLLGNQWTESAPILGFFLGAGILTTLNYINGATIVSIGRPQARFWFSLLRAIVGSVLLAVATPIGMVWVGVAFLLRGCIVEPLQLNYLLRRIDGSILNYMQRLGSAVVGAVILAAVGFGTTIVLADMPDILVLPAAASTGLLAYFVAMLITDKGLLTEIHGLLQKEKS